MNRYLKRIKNRIAGKPAPGVMFIGTGQAARGLGHALSKGGARINGFWSRTGKRVRGHRSYTGGMASACQNSDAVLICVPDRIISDVIKVLSAGNVSWHGKVVAHVSGALDSTVLEPLRKKGAFTAVLHPFFSFTAGMEPTLSDIPFSVEGEAGAVEKIRSLFEPLGIRMTVLDPRHKALYHAAAVFCSNFTVALQLAAETMLNEAGIKSPDAQMMITALLGSVALNVSQKGPVGSLTGPVVRKDIETIEKHLNVLKKRQPKLLPAYIAMTLLLSEHPSVRGDKVFNRELKKLMDNFQR